MANSDEKKVKHSNLVSIHLPMKAEHVTYEDVVRTMIAIRDAPKPVLIHCRRGSDRTGCMVAFYRLVFLNWEKEAAIEAFADPRFGYLQGFFPNLVELIRITDMEQLKKEILSSSYIQKKMLRRIAFSTNFTIFGAKLIIIRMKKSLLFGGIMATAAFAQLNAQCLQNYAYRTELSIDNSSNNQELNEYQISLTLNTQDMIAQGKLNVDGSDLRFGGDCCNLYCHYVESGMNTPTTKIWVRIPGPIAGNSTQGLLMFYGNPTASNVSDPNCVFDLYDGFDSGVSFATSSCGIAATSAVNAGVLDLSWSSDYVLTSDQTFPQGTLFRAEIDVTAASGNWPGLYWFKNSDTRGYGTLLGGSTVRISKSGSSNGYCQGHNWASLDYSAGSASGLWSLTWIATGILTGNYPGVALNSTDTEISRDSDLRVGIGGISGGSGNMSVNWLRVRKYTALEPTVSVLSETLLPAIDLGEDITECAEEVSLDAGSGFTSYTWNSVPAGQILDVTSSGYYEVVADDSYGCQFVDGNNVTLNLPVQADFNVSSTGLSSTFTNTSVNGGGSSSWDFGDGGSSISSSPTHNYAISGSYEVCLTETAASGCFDEYCETITVGVAELSDLNLNYSLYPNPTSIVLMVNLFKEIDSEYQITDLNGKTVLTGKVQPGENAINVDLIEPGTYFFTIKGERFSDRFVKQ